MLNYILGKIIEYYYKARAYVRSWIDYLLRKASEYARYWYNRARDFIKEQIRNVKGWINYYYDKAISWVNTNYNKAISWINTQIRNAKDWIDYYYYKARDWAWHLYTRARLFVQEQIRRAKGWIDYYYNEAIGWINTQTANAKGWIDYYYKKATDWTNYIYDSLIKAWKTFLDPILKAWARLSEIADELYEWYKGAKETLNNFVADPVGYILALIRDKFLEWLLDLIADNW